MDRPYGMHQKAFEAYIAACVEAGINPDRVMQTIGNAAASAGTHAKDGDFSLKLTNGTTVKRPYAACTDIRSKDLTEREIYVLLRALAKRGICPYWRKQGSFANNQHIHFIWSGCYMKPSVQRQVKDFLQSLDGLASHGRDFYWWKNPIGVVTAALIKKLFNASNPNQLLRLDVDGDSEEDYECGCCEIDFNSLKTVKADDEQGENTED